MAGRSETWVFGRKLQPRCGILSRSCVATSESEAVYHFKLAADGGHEIARYILGKIDHNNGNTEQAMKHYKIAARAGCNSAMACIETGYTEGYINKRECLDTYQEYYKSLHCASYGNR